jgi:glycosyltransferase involved in cell wall biosynthesis
VLARALSALSVRHFMPHDEAMQRAILAAQARERCDLVFDLGGLMLANLPPKEASPPVLVDSIDEPGITFERALRHATWREKPGLWRTRRLYELVNAKISTRVAVNVYASELDAAHYAREFPGSRVETIPNGVDTEFFAPRPGASEPDLVAFEGNLSFEPNVDAARVLCTDVLPRVWKERPGVRAVLVGRDPTPEVRAFASGQVEVTGTVADVRDALCRASVFACPMRLGAGIKNKVLQAWALGLPVVATPQALGGLAALDGVNALIRADPPAFAQAVCKLLADRELARELGRNGRELVVQRYTWRAQAERFDALFREVAGAKS